MLFELVNKNQENTRLLVYVSSIIKDAYKRSRWTYQGCLKEDPCLQPDLNFLGVEADTDLSACSCRSDFQGLQKVHLQSHYFSSAAEFSHWHLCQK